MSNLFEGCKINGEKWRIKEERNFNAEELDMVSYAQVVDSDYGLLCCFTIKSGGITLGFGGVVLKSGGIAIKSCGVTTYIPMSKDANVSVGDVIDLSKAKVLTLERPRKQDAYRIYYDHNV